MFKNSKASKSQLARHFGYAFVVTILVAIAPVVVVSTVPPFTSLDRYLSIAAGMALSLAVTQATNFAWVKWFATGDLVFGDLMLWGWVRKVRVERRVTRVAEKLRVLEHPTTSDSLSIETKTKILTDLVEALEARDSYTHGHSRRVTRHSFMIAKAMGLPPAEIERIRIAASVHDVGKLNVPLSIIRKPRKLTDAEFAQIAEHSVKGAALVAPLRDDLLTAIVRHHHERIDGSGYPDRISGNEIPLGARIIAVADTFDAITSTRAYRKAARHSTALKIIKKEAGAQLDRDVVKAFLGYYSGRRSIEWWMVVTTLPQRAWASLGGWGRSAVAMPAVNGIAAAGTAALVATSLAPAWQGPVVPERASEGAVQAVAEAHDESNPASTNSHGVGAKGRGANGPNHGNHGKKKGHNRNRGKGNKGGKGRSKDRPVPQGNNGGGGSGSAVAAARPEQPAAADKPAKPAKEDRATAETTDGATDEVAAAPAPAPAPPAGNGPPDKPEKPAKP